MKKIVTTVLATLAGLLGIANARGAENPFYDPEYDPDVQTVYSSIPMYDPDSPHYAEMTFEGATPIPGEE